MQMYIIYIHMYIAVCYRNYNYMRMTYQVKGVER